MSYACISRVLAHSRQTGTAKLLLIAIAAFAEDDGTGAAPSIATLARLAGTGERNVQLVLRKLEQTGELGCEIGAGPDGCNRYTICVADDADPALTPVHTGSSIPNLASPTEDESAITHLDESQITQLKEGEKEGGRGTPPRIDDQALPTPAGERPLHADPWTLWQTGRAVVDPLDAAHLHALADSLDGPTGGYGAYWLGRAILAASVCDPLFATNPRALNLVRAILRRWMQEHSYGSDTGAYHARLEARHDRARAPEQRLAAPRGRAPQQPHDRTPGSHRPERATAPLAACTIIGRDAGAD